MVSKFLELIEVSIRNKDHSEVSELITKYLKLERYSKIARLKASEFYRRISLYSKGLELLHWQNESFQWKTLDEQEIRIRLQSIRLLNLLGASSFAVKMLDTIEPKIQQKYYEIIAPIYLSNGRNAEAAELYSFLKDLPDRDLDYQTRLRLIGLADAYSGLEKYEKALQIAERVQALSSEPAILAILPEAMGSYCLLAGNLKKAATFQTKAKSFYQENETTVDYGYLLKWIGGRLVLEDKFEEAKKVLAQAFSILYQKGFKPEVWLEVKYWQGLLEWKKNPKFFPDIWRMLLGYPTVGTGFQKQISKWAPLPAVLKFNESPEVKTILHFREGMSVSKVKNTLGLDLPEKILANLLPAGEWGVPFYRMCDAIYEDLYSFGQHYKRLDQGLGRLRAEGMKVEWKDMHLCWTPNQKSNQFQSTVNLHSRGEGGLFFEMISSKKDSRFTRVDVEGYFSLSRSRAASLCQKWVEANLLTVEKEGRAVFYRLVGKS